MVFPTDLARTRSHFFVHSIQPKNTPQHADFNLIVISLACNIYCVGQTTTLAVCGTSLSLRGPDGSMIRAVDGMYVARARARERSAMICT